MERYLRPVLPIYASDKSGNPLKLAGSVTIIRKNRRVLGLTARHVMREVGDYFILPLLPHSSHGLASTRTFMTGDQSLEDSDLAVIDFNCDTEAITADLQPIDIDANPICNLSYVSNTENELCYQLLGYPDDLQPSDYSNGWKSRLLDMELTGAKKCIQHSKRSPEARKRFIALRYRKLLSSKDVLKGFKGDFNRCSGGAVCHLDQVPEKSLAGIILRQDPYKKDIAVTALRIEVIRSIVALTL